MYKNILFLLIKFNFVILQGIWKISSNTNEEQEDFERAESFSNHLFKATVLLIEVLEKSGDRFNLLEMSKMFYQKMDAEKYFFKFKRY